MADLTCKRDGCGHPMSRHTMKRAEKRAKLEGTIVLDFPSSGQKGSYNYHSGMTDGDACSEDDCRCTMFDSGN